MSPASDPAGSPDGDQSFLKLFLGEMGVRMTLLLVAMLLSFAGSVIGAAVSEDGKAPGAFIGLAGGIVVYAVVVQRFNRRPDPRHDQTSPDATGR